MKEQLEKKVEYHQGGAIRIEYQINQKRQKYGAWKSFYENRNLSSQTEFKNNQLNGLYKDKWYVGSFKHINIQKKNERFGMMIEFSN